MKKITRAELEFRLAKAERELAAHREWFTCESQGLPRLEVPVRAGRDVAMTVRVQGAGRSAGGVCVVELAGVRHHPEYLDDLRNRWAADPAPEIRQAAEDLARRREEYLRPCG